MSLLVDNLSRTLERALDLRLDRQNLIASNLANVDTPGYQPVDLRFEETLRSMLDDRGGGLPPSAAEAFFDPAVTPGADGNGVDLDREMSRSSINSMLYSTALRLHQGRTQLLRLALTEGAR